MIASGWQAWSRFWFESDSPSRMRLFRLAFGLLIFALYLIRSLDLELYFSNEGVLPLSVVRELMPLQYRPSILHYWEGDAPLWSLHALFLLSLLSMAAGIFPRASAIVALVLHVSFIHRNMASVYGVDLISTFFLFYLCFANGREDAGSASRTLGSMVFRLSQLQVCIIYGYSGLEKLKGGPWWKGEAIWDVLANAQLARWDFSFVSYVPLLIVLATYTTLIWEVYFPVLIWLPRFRYPMLFFGVLLHIGIGVGLSIPFFGTLMIVTYALFLEDRHAKRLLSKVTPL